MRAMERPRLILVEGVPGTGKSTLAQTVTHALHAAGTPSHWWYEQQRDHPLYPFDDRASQSAVAVRVFGGDHPSVVDDVLVRWHALAASLAAPESPTVVMDGMLFGHLTWTLFPAAIEPEEIAGYVHSAASLVSVLHPVLINLTVDDVDAHLERLAARRGAPWMERSVAGATDNPYARARGYEGIDGAARYWRDYSTLTARLFDELPIARTRIAIDDGWQKSQGAALRFLGLEPAPNVGRAIDLSDIAGRYDSTDDAPATDRCEVRVEGAAAVIDGMSGVWRATPLAPRGAATFDVFSLPVTLSFARDGAAVTMTRSGPQLLSGPHPARYRRIDA